MKKHIAIISLVLVLIVVHIVPTYEIDIQINPNLPPELQASQKKVIEQLADHEEKVKIYTSGGISDTKTREKDIGNWVYDPKNDKWYFETGKGERKLGWINPYGNEWYFMDFFTEEMKIGYHIINGAVYYFEESKNGVVPQGQLYRSRATLDGYAADETGLLVNYTRHLAFLR